MGSAPSRKTVGLRKKCPVQPGNTTATTDGDAGHVPERPGRACSPTSEFGFNAEFFAKEEAKLKRHRLARRQNLVATLNY